MTEQADKIKPLKKGAVVYPQAYHVDKENPDNSYLEGVTQGGQPIVAYLRVSDEHKERQSGDSQGRTLPSIKDLSSMNPAAPRRCEASSDNGPDNATKGVLLVEQISRMEGPQADAHPGKFVCESKWISILQQSSYMPAKMTKGYVEISFHRGLDSEQKKQKAKYLSLRQRLTNPSESILQLKEEMQAIQRELIQSRKLFLSVVDMQVENLHSINVSELEGVAPQDRGSMLRSKLEELLEPLTHTGMYGGAILRLRDGGMVSPLYTSTIAMQYDFKNGKVLPFSDVYANWLKFDGQKLSGAFMKASPRMNLTLDIIPCQRINFGPKSNDPYKADILRLESSKTLKTYIDEEARADIGVIDLTPNDYLASFMASRSALAGDGNCIISRAHSYTGPMVKAVLFGPDMTQYKMSDPNSAKASGSRNATPVTA